MQAWERRDIPDENAGGRGSTPATTRTGTSSTCATSISAAAQAAAMRPGNDRTTIVTFAVVALLILGMAVVNFTNLATARASQRAREVALRKVLGASRRQLIVQFLGESILMPVVAMLIALALVEVLCLRGLPRGGHRRSATGRRRHPAAGAAAGPLVVGILGGLYPAFFLSRFQPAPVLKANQSVAETPGTGRLRKRSSSPSSPSRSASSSAPR